MTRRGVVQLQKVKAVDTEDPVAILSDEINTVHFCPTEAGDCVFALPLAELNIGRVIEVTRIVADDEDITTTVIAGGEGEAAESIISATDGLMADGIEFLFLDDKARFTAVKNANGAFVWVAETYLQPVPPPEEP